MRYLLLVAFLAVAGCKKEVEIKDDIVVEDGIVVMPTAISRQDCDKDFDVFFEKFSNDSVFQRKHVKFPLKSSHLDNDYHDMIREDITFVKYRFMDFKGHKDAMKQEYDKFTVETIKKKDTINYLLKGDDNGIYIEVKFAFENDCWYLVAIEDSST